MPMVRSKVRDDVERAHLIDPSDHTFSIERCAVSPDLSELARRFWIPVWSVPAGQTSHQYVLQYPVCLLVVSNSYARFYGVVSGLSSTALEGRGWAVGVMLQPAAGFLLTGAPVRHMTDRHVDLSAVTGLDATGLSDRVREAMANDPESSQGQAQARHIMETALRGLLPVDDEGRFVNAVVEHVENSPDLLRVDELCQRFDMGERALQRLLHKRIGLSPKWLIRRRRLQEGADRLREHHADLAAIAAELGYTDQAHFTRDFRSATGLTPGRFAARFH